MTWFLLFMADRFEWLRWAGVAYLVYLGVQQWRAEPEAVPASSGQTRGRAPVSHARPDPPAQSADRRAVGGRWIGPVAGAAGVRLERPS